MKLSVIIVNYNVEHFLEQCLYAVRKAMQQVSGEVIVVDNNSIDGSNRMVREKFPEVALIANTDNKGFSKANNQGIRISKGEYVLLLNPDTVVEDDTFLKIVNFMDEHPRAGALGVKMVDGSGNFLPESKRGLPTPSAAAYKMFGLSKLFPKSKRFAKYHLGYLDENQTNEVEILAGAFMLLRKTVLDEIGLLDESFFMYGEDIDLSYRVIQAGYRNYYFPETRIIHYKGESTKKSSVNYVLVFYNAMVIFAKKHFTHKNARAFTFVINIAIYFRAFLAILSQLWEKLMLPLVDGAAMVGGFYLITKLWGDSFIYKEGGSYPLTFVYYIIPSYIVLWLLSIYFSGGYDKPVRIKKAVGGLLLGTVLILVLYALLPESMRFSRALILLGTLWGLLVLPVVRLLFHWMKVPWVALGDKQSKRFLVIGEKDEAKRVMELLESSFVKPGFIGLASVDKQTVNAGDYIGNISQAKDIITIYNIDEVVFCSKNISHQTIIDKMAEWQQMEVDYKIAPEDSLSIIGSNSIHTRGDLYTVNINAVDKTANRRNKRLMDVFASLMMLLFSPFLVFFERKPAGFLKNIFCVLFGRKTWVGFCQASQADFQLPKIKPGVLCPLDGMKVRQQNKETIHQLNLLYARDYNLLKDVNIILFAFRDLGK
ncbi:MAG: glycosyltransferase family 2 protein [Bacteroidales bacterium]|nr:glycosyltransferase family 2 protein [Bacteroidales bacterium]